MVLPILEDLDTNNEEHKPHVFLRNHLLRNVALVVVRLHDAPNERAKGTRVIASIRSLLDHASAENRLTSNQIREFARRREAIVAAYEARGESFCALRDFRHAEVAHSLHLSGQSAVRLPLHPLWDLAHDTFELVLETENELVRSGSGRMIDLDGKFNQWRDRGEKFWSSRL
jgi:hypothetical protein